MFQRATFHIPSPKSVIRWTVTCLALSLLAAGPGSAQSGLIGHWTLDEGRGTVAGDSSGFGHDGTLLNKPSWVLGNVGGALSLNGIDHAVQIADSPVLTGPAELTLSAWIRHPPVTQYRAIIDKRDDYPDGYDLYISPLGRLFMRVNREKVEGMASVADNTWRHVAGVYDGQKISLYVDGRLDFTTAVQPTQLDTDAPLFLGRFFGGLGSSFQGQMDDVRIYARALPASEVASLVSSGGPSGGGSSDGDWVVRGPDMRSGVPGNVGIGTASPAAKLHVVGDARVQGDVQADGQVCDGSGACIGDTSSLWSANGSHTYVSGGNVGIGTSSPSNKLDVVGNIKATGSVCDGAGRCIGDGSGAHVGKECPNAAYLAGFYSNGGLICRCLPGYVYNGSACAVPAPGVYRYHVSAYGGCAGAGMDVHLERRYTAQGWEYRTTYKFRSDYVWQSAFNYSPWFRGTTRFSWAHGRDNPWFEVALSNGSILFRRGDCKGGTNPSWGYSTWPLSDANF